MSSKHILLTGKAYQEHSRFWSRQLSGLEEVSHLPRAIRTSGRNDQLARYRVRLGEEAQATVLHLGANQNTGILVVLLSGLIYLLAKYTGDSAISLKTPLLQTGKIEEVYADEVILFAEVDKALPVREFLRSMGKTVSESYKFQNFPLETIFDDIALPFKTSSRVMVNFPQIHHQPVELSGYDLALEVAHESGEIQLDFLYDTSVFDEQSIAAFARQLETILVSCKKLETKLGDISLLSETEREQVLLEFSRTQTGHTQNKTIHQIFEEQVRTTPDSIALVAGVKRLTYRELNEKANQLAHYLREVCDVQADDMVGLMVHRSEWMMIGLLGILKAGGAYVPLDPNNPAERLDHILSEANMKALLVDSDFMMQVSSCEGSIFLLDAQQEELNSFSRENLANICQPINLAYVMHTSGSTGMPKGVCITHQAVVRLVKDTDYFDLVEEETFLQLAPILFDASTFEIFGALLNGARLVMMLTETPSLSEIGEALRQHRVTTLWLTSGLFNLMADAELEELKLVRQILAGGDVLSVAHVEKLMLAAPDNHRLINGYGPTENTTFTCCHLISSEDTRRASIPIGKPIANTEVYVLDERLHPVPTGVPAELFVSGSGLARGYLLNPALTALRFIPHPFSHQPGARLYRTGDRARFLPDGSLEYLGRTDRQVKLRGFRIELGEIEAALLAHPQVRQAVVLLEAQEVSGAEGTAGQRAGRVESKRLVAYVVGGRGERVAMSEVREQLQRKLPDYMLPGRYVELAEMPLTANGKVDVRALERMGREQQQQRGEQGVGQVAAESEVERLVAQIWREVLGVEAVGVEDNFFELGGDSLRCIQVLARMQEQGLNCSIEHLFQHQTIRSLADALEVSDSEPTHASDYLEFSLISEEDRASITEDVEDAYPLTSLQLGMLFHSQYSPGSAYYHDIYSYHLRAAVNIHALRHTLRQLLARHQILRASFALSGFSQPLQLINRKVNVRLELSDLRDLPADKQEEALDVFIEEEKERDFDWTEAPLIRFFCHRRGEDTFQFTISFHHAILDGWSLATMMTEFFKLYISNIKQSNAVALQPPSKIKFSNFVDLERKAIDSQEARQYWINKLDGYKLTKLPRWPLPTRKPQPAQVFAHDINFSAELTKRLKQLAARASVPLKSILLASHFRVLSLLSGQSDVTTGLVSNGRPEEKDADEVLGLFLNTLPLRQQLSGGSWFELIQETFKSEREMYPFRRYPLAKLQNELDGAPPFEVAFNFVHFHIYHRAMKFTEMEYLGGKFFDKNSFLFTTTFSLNTGSSDVQLRLSYQSPTFSREQIAAIADYYEQTLRAMVDDPLADYQNHLLLTAQDRLLLKANEQTARYENRESLSKLFEAQVERTPNAVALVFEDTQLTYHQLNERANQLAHYLQSLGVEPETLVALCFDRSLEMVIALLGVLKAGGAYVPLDPNSPPERLAFMLQDSGAKLLLTQSSLSDQLYAHGLPLLCLDEKQAELSALTPENPVGSEVLPQHLAYLIYTSGSTGAPKGVMVTHDNVTRLFAATEQWFHFDERDIWTLFHSYTFDFSVWEIWGALLYGGRLVIVPYWVSRSPESFYRLLVEQQVTVLNQTPSSFQQLNRTEEMLDNSAELALRLVVFGGEALELQSLRSWFDRHGDEQPRLVNMYGITETTVHVTYSEIRIAHLNSGVGSLIGERISDLQVYVLDERLHPVPTGVPAELFVSGHGLARGYLLNPALTALRFIPHPFSHQPGARLYRTGDRARFLPDGSLEYLGRTDRQVKLRGFRIELGEIEAALLAHPQVRQAVVLLEAQEMSGAEGTAGQRAGRVESKRLVAYVVGGRGERVAMSEVREQLQRKLPDYMLPGRYVELAEMPLTANGKVDVRALERMGREQQQQRGEQGVGQVAAESEVERLVAQIWREVLGVEAVGVEDNFFELGGDSLLATLAMSRVCEACQVDIALRHLFDEPTVSALARRIETGLRDKQGLQPASLKSVLRDGQIPLSFQQESLLKTLWEKDAHDQPFFNIFVALSLKGQLNAEALEQTLNEIIRRHEALRTTFDEVDGQLVQVIAPAWSFTVSRLELSHLPASERETQTQHEIAGEINRAFDLKRDLLLRASLLHLAEEEYVLILTTHHLVSDAWSLKIFFEEFVAIYQAYSAGNPSPLPKPAIQYADFAYWQRRFADTEGVLAYWKKQLHNWPLMELPLDHPRPVKPSWQGAHHFFTLSPASLPAKLKALCREKGCTLHMLLLAAYQLLLHGYTGQEDILINTPSANRHQAETHGVIGYFANNLLLRTSLSGDPTFSELLKRVRSVALEAYANQDAPLKLVKEALGIERTQVAFALQPTMRPASLSLPGLCTEPVKIDPHTSPSRQVSKRDLSLYMWEDDDGRLQGMAEYSTELFESRTIERMGQEYQRLLERVVAEPNLRLSELVAHFSHNGAHSTASEREGAPANHLL